MRDIAGFLQTSAEKTGFVRECYKPENIPTEPSDIIVVPFFGDIRSLFILSTFLLHRYKEQDKPSKYMIICSWPGFSCLFPYVDEYWSIQSESNIRKIYPQAVGFSNKSDLINQYYRGLNQYFFEDLVDVNSQFSHYYNCGLTNEFFKKYKEVKRFLPSIASSVSVGRDFAREFMDKGGGKVFIYPAAYISSWSNNHCKLMSVPREFWIRLVDRLVEENFVPIICKSFCTYDLSTDSNKKCIYFSDTDVGKILTVMRMTGCVLDLFTGVSRLALMARVPFISADERSRYVALKEYELDDLCGINIPKKYIFSFSTIINGGNIGSWDFDILNSIVIKLKDLLPTIDRDQLPSPVGGFEIVPYDLVRNKKLKRIGTRLLKILKDD